jgi:hypothetical protein
MPMLVTQSQNELEVEKGNSFSYKEEEEKSTGPNDGLTERKEPSITIRKLVQVTMFGTAVKKIKSKLGNVKVKAHLRRKSVALKRNLKAKSVTKNATKTKGKFQKKGGVEISLVKDVVNDPSLGETTKLMAKMKFDDMMELRERVFPNVCA